eukprot:COSAG02_NODE_3268_length_7047_cov_3.408463_3_plen_128_part_00
MVHGSPLAAGGSFSGIVAAFLDGISGISTGCNAPVISSRVAPNISLPFSVWFAASSKCQAMHTFVKALMLLSKHETWPKANGPRTEKHERVHPGETHQTIRNRSIQPLSSTSVTHKPSVITAPIMQT